MSSSSIRPASLALETEAGRRELGASVVAPSPSTPSGPPALLAGLRSSLAPHRLSSATLLADRREVEIEHAGQIYRLRVTSLGKLILTK